MPSIKEAMGADLSGYTPMDTPKYPVLSQMITGGKPKANPSIRCPLPPFNSDPDTLRQFEIGTEMPQVRVVPLPPLIDAAPTRSIVSTSSAATSSSSSSTTTKLLPLSQVLQTGVMGAGTSFTGSLQLLKSFQLLSLSSTLECEVRLYGSSAAQAFDLSRAEGDPVPPEIMSNIISCVTFDQLPYTWPFQNIIGVNQDTPQNSTLYVTVFNTDVSAVTNISVTVAYLPLEN